MALVDALVAQGAVDEGNAVDDTEGGGMEQGEGRGALPPSAPTPIDTYFTPEEKGGLEVRGVPAISPMALPCCFCARKATGICRSVAPALATASDLLLHSSGFRARECLRSALPFSSLYMGLSSH